MAVRAFDRVDDRIALALGGLNFTSPHTLAVVAKKGIDGALMTAFHIGTDSGAVRMGIAVNASNQIVARISGNLLVATGFTWLVSDGWVLITVSKATGTFAARIHKRVIGAGSGTFANSTATSGNATVPTTGAYIGSTATATSELFNGRIA